MSKHSPWSARLSDEVLQLLNVRIAGSRCGRQGNVECRHSSQFTSMRAVGKWRCSVHGGAIVPDYQIPLSPHVTIDELRLSRMFDEFAQHQSPLWRRPVDNL